MRAIGARGMNVALWSRRRARLRCCAVLDGLTACRRRGGEAMPGGLPAWGVHVSGYGGKQLSVEAQHTAARATKEAVGAKPQKRAAAPRSAQASSSAGTLFLHFVAAVASSDRFLLAGGCQGAASATGSSVLTKRQRTKHAV